MWRMPDRPGQASARLARAQALLARQRDRIRQRQEAGLDVGKFLALLETWEQIVEQMHISRGLLLSIGLRLCPDDPPLQGRPEVESSPSPPLPLRQTLPAAFHCPYCALTLRLQGGNGALVYDVPDWHRRCHHKALSSPALCQLIPQSTVILH